MITFDEIPELILPDCSPSMLQGRILIAEAWNATPHLETGAEIALRLSKAGYKVDYVFYGHLLPHVECFNALGSSIQSRLIYGEKSPQRKILNILRANSSHNKLDIRILHPSTGIKAYVHSIPIAYLGSLARLKLYSTSKYKNIGVSVASSLVSQFKDSSLTPLLQYDMCKKLATSYERSFRLAERILETRDISLTILFNGRFACVKGVADCCNDQGVKLMYHERGSSKDMFSLNDYQPHDRLRFQREVSLSWNRKAKSNTIDTRLAQSFYESRRAGSPASWKSFTSHQVTGSAKKLTEEAKARSSSGTVITFFSSSEDEFIAVDDAFHRDAFEWKSQAEAFALLAELALAKGHSIILRQHPNLADKSVSDSSKWSELSFMNPELRSRVINVNSASDVSTYELIDASDLIVCYGSTVGIEAIFWSRPSMLLSNSFYDQLEASLYQPKSKAELSELLGRIPDLTVAPETALAYGDFSATFGIPYCLYKPESLFSGSFCGLRASEPRPSLRRKLVQGASTRLRYINIAFLRYAYKGHF